MIPCSLHGWWNLPMQGYDVIAFFSLIAFNMGTFIFYKRDWRPPARLTRFGDRE